MNKLNKFFIFFIVLHIYIFGYASSQQLLFYGKPLAKHLLSTNKQYLPEAFHDTMNPFYNSKTFNFTPQSKFYADGSELLVEFYPNGQIKFKTAISSWQKIMNQVQSSQEVKPQTYYFKTIYYDKNGGVEKTRFGSYSQDGSREISSYDNYGILRSQEINNFDDNGNIIETYYSNPQSWSMPSVTMQYIKNPYSRTIVYKVFKGNLIENPHSYLEKIEITDSQGITTELDKSGNPIIKKFNNGLESPIGYDNQGEFVGVPEKIDIDYIDISKLSPSIAEKSIKKTFGYDENQNYVGLNGIYDFNGFNNKKINSKGLTKQDYIDQGRDPLTGKLIDLD